MEFKELIETRRSYRSLAPVEITSSIVEELGKAAQLTPSCGNCQPWRFIFTSNQKLIEQLYSTLSKGNEWARKSSMIITVFSKKDLDCVFPDREYFLFDTGIATAHIILRATDLGLTAHPIAGFNSKKVKKILGIPDDMTVITLIIVGKKADKINPDLSENQKKGELNRPPRLKLEQFIYKDKYK